MERPHKNEAGEEALDRVSKEAEQDENERRTAWLDATLKKLARRAMGVG